MVVGAIFCKYGRKNGNKGLFDAILAGNVDYMACGERYGHKKELRIVRLCHFNL